MIKLFGDDDFDVEGSDSFSPGGISDETISADETSVEEEVVTKRPNLNYESGTYADYPSIPDQFDKFPDTVKIGYPQVAVFNLRVESDLVAYNAILKRTYPDSAPDIVIVDNRVSDDFCVMITYKKLTYLIPG